MKRTGKRRKDSASAGTTNSQKPVETNDKLITKRYDRIERINKENMLPASVTDEEMETGNRFLDHIRNNPFIALVVTEDEGVRIYAREDVDKDVLSELREALGAMIEEGRS